MTPREIKVLGSSVWGAQSGLLSVAELELLWGLVQQAFIDADKPDFRLLEIGHYHGLSTCCIVHALSELAPVNTKLVGWEMLTVDSHEADQWVGKTDPMVFVKNYNEHFNDDRCQPIFDRSQHAVAPLEYDAIFYDGDHGQEQARFTGEVMASDRVKLFIFDDRDFQVPAACCATLRDAGWVDESPPLVRMAVDKMDPLTQTLGVFRRSK